MIWRNEESDVRFDCVQFMAIHFHSDDNVNLRVRSFPHTVDNYVNTYVRCLPLSTLTKQSHQLPSSRCTCILLYFFQNLGPEIYGSRTTPSLHHRPHSQTKENF